MLLGQEKMNPEDISTVIMDMLLIGVNTVRKWCFINVYIVTVV